MTDQLRARLEAAHIRIRSLSVELSPDDHRQSIRCHVRWPTLDGPSHPPAILQELGRLPGLVRLVWRATGTKSS